MKVLVTVRLPERLRSLLEGHHHVVINGEDRPADRQWLLDGIRDKEGLICTVTDRIDQELLSRASRLKMIANYGVGVDNIDLTAATAANLPVSNTPDVLTDATADLAFALILSTARRIVEGDRRTRGGAFQFFAPFLFLGSEVSRKTLGIIGLGRIGKAVANRARGFDMQILYYRRHRLDPTDEGVLGIRFAEMGDLLAQSDFVSVHVPLTRETKHLIGKKELAVMKATAFLINTSRGPVVDEASLVEVLREGGIAGAGLDVYEDEPRLAPGLADLPNTVLLPHVGSATLETRTQMASMAVENLMAGLKGERPPNCLNWDDLS
jgi:glyoxylate reductase